MKPKSQAPRSFRAWRENEERLQYADKVGINVSELDSAHRGHAGLIVRLLALTGMRIGQARKLTWADVTAQGVRVPAQKNGR